MDGGGDGLDYEVEPVSLRAPSPEYLDLNPLGGAPFLVDGEVRIAESVAMMLYLAGRYGPTPLTLQPHEPGYAEYLQFLVLGEASLGTPINVFSRGQNVVSSGPSITLAGFSPIALSSK